MSANRYRPHLHILPEDAANNDLLTGFTDACSSEQIQALPAAGGWRRAVELLGSVHAAEMRVFPARLMVLLIDFDRDTDRFAAVQRDIPDDLKDRVFVLGVWSEPEDLAGSREDIGFALGSECLRGEKVEWRQPLLRHNEPELNRLCEGIRPILFPRV